MFSDLKSGRASQSVVMQTLIKDHGVYMLLLDEKATFLQGNITFRRLNTFKHFLKEGSAYQLNGNIIVQFRKKKIILQAKREKKASCSENSLSENERSMKITRTAKTANMKKSIQKTEEAYIAKVEQLAKLKTKAR
ncbi:hypothetical protein IGI04_030564 [Brassica rapa subsp. trilocularis]|uniref:Uncharacterized protein n=1 Tax=Brassica rapa subsp. trilocularis TaxID=1813537 RepID=A0ABQ7LTS2_BRACM|nr:hypothetical protein IGI04_030564 [Brassica rapa subsp. trilocularis]